MPVPAPAIDQYVQWGALTILAYLTVWVTIKGFPRVMDSHDTQIRESSALVKYQQDLCRAERAELTNQFLAERNSIAERFLAAMEKERDLRHKSNDAMAAAFGSAATEIAELTTAIRDLLAREPR